MKFATRCRKYREKKGLSQTDFARQLKVSQGLINHWEQGRRLPGWRLAIRIEKETNGEITREHALPDAYL